MNTTASRGEFVDSSGLAGQPHAWTGLIVWLVASVSVIAVGDESGGYFPSAWGWCVLAFGWIGAMALIMRARPRVSRLELWFVASLLLLIGWTALSIAWSSDAEQSVLEVQRALVYLAAVVAVLLAVRRSSVPHLLAGLLTGTFFLAVSGLASRLFPGAGPDSELVQLSRLAEPIGYANALGLFAVMGVHLALGFVAHGRTLAGRAAAAATLPVLLTTAYFTYSRGAGFALAVGLIVMVAFDRRRLTSITAALLMAVPVGATVWLASRAPGLTDARATRSLIADEGRELTWMLLAMMIASAIVAVTFAVVESRVRTSVMTRRMYGGVLACMVVVAVVGGVAHHGGPGPLADKVTSGFNKDLPTATDPKDTGLNRRLGNLGSTQRVRVWEVARDQFEDHPLIGAGAGTFEEFWLRDRPQSEPVRDGHSLYLETLAQLGVPGLAFLLALLAVPLVGALRARTPPLATGALGAFGAYLVHTGIDWDWEMPILTLIALVCGVAVLAAHRDPQRPRMRLSIPWRVAGAVATVAVAAFSVVGLVGNGHLADATDANNAGDFESGQRDARSAVDWAPWSAEAQHQLGRAQVGLGLRAQGRASLRESTRMNGADWSVWYDLGLASRGRARQRAFLEAARMNPLEDDIQELREAGRIVPQSLDE